MPVIETAQWRVKKANHDKFLNLVVHGPYNDDSMGLTYQSKHPEIYRYAKTRTWSRPLDDSDEEDWFFIDEYNSMDDYHESHKNYASQAEEVHMEKMTKLQSELMVPDSLQGPYVWEEQPGTNIQFADRL
ncbi:hypothetical protein [Ligilactobacillus acidipiscis]|uniref:hypothetical protein n=1 Tax=Ligilactobacillus acidipiscis TaxID=89059 RepID=UPI0023F74FB4|nr:hypothetical protein [Ligilactobacillus acidipiscis]WEV57439.1 hypothetical protein OZX66_02525 [Ligilactobacillus acidipiscis]